VVAGGGGGGGGGGGRGGGRRGDLCSSCCCCCCWSPTRCAGTNGDVVDSVDMFNATSGVWTTAALSVARNYFAATSLPNERLAIFAGGASASYVLMSVIAGGGVLGGGGRV
jgi:hypothetical protein